MKTLIVLTFALALAGCATWQRVDKPEAEAPDKSYRVNLPLGWVRSMQDRDGISVTRDGMALNRIVVRRRELDQAYPKLQRPARADMLPSELAELQIAELKTAAKSTVITVQENVPAQISGQPGYRLRVEHRNNRGLRFEQVICGLATAKGYFTLGFTAPALHYWGRDLPAFEQVVASFRLADR